MGECFVLAQRGEIAEEVKFTDDSHGAAHGRHATRPGFTALAAPSGALTAKAMRGASALMDAAAQRREKNRGRA